MTQGHSLLGRVTVIAHLVFFVENHAFGATKKSGHSENQKQKVHIYTALLLNQYGMKQI